MSAARFRLLLSLLTLATAPLVGCPEPPPEPETVIRPVRFEVVSTAQESAVRTFVGVAAAGTESDLSFRVAGNLETVAVSVGDTVSAGDLIAQLDTSDYEVQREQASADVSAARAQQRNAEADFNRMRSLYEDGSASLSDLDAARAAADSTRAQVRAARQQVARARDQIEYCTLVAPMDGQIAAVPADENENVQAGQVVAQLTSAAEEQLEVDLNIPETVIARVRRGMEAQVSFDALGGRPFAATVTEVGVMMVGNTFPVTVQLDTIDLDIRAGMTATVAFTFEDVDTSPRIWLAAYAVGEDRNGRYVYLVDPGEETGLGVIRRQEVEVGTLDNRGLEILTGLSEGDRVVTAGLSRIVAGQTVRFVAPGNPADGPAPPASPAPSEGTGEGR